MAAMLLCAPQGLAQSTAAERTVTAPVDWAAVNAQLVGGTDARSGAPVPAPLARAPLAVRDLIPEGYGSARSLSLRPRIPVLIPLFATATNGSGGRTLRPEERNFLPIVQAGEGSGARSFRRRAPAAEQPSTMLFPESNSYAATIKLPQGATVMISGSNVARAVALNDGAARVLSGRRGETEIDYGMTDILTEQTETGYAISFTRFGVAYNVEIECVILKDVRCTDPSFVRELALSVGLVGDPPP